MTARGRIEHYAAGTVLSKWRISWDVPGAFTALCSTVAEGA